MPNQFRQRDPLERFWEKVNQDGPTMPGMESQCWVWTGYLGPSGHGKFRIGGVNERRIGPHSFAWKLENEPPPPGFILDHRCRNASCVRVSHLRVVTNKQNGENQSPLAHSSNRTSRYRGVYLTKNGRWGIRAKHNGKTHWSGSYETEEEAAVAVQALRNRLHTHNDADRE